MSKDGSIWQLFVLFLLALGDTVPKRYVLLQFGTPLKRKKLPNGLLPPPAFERLRQRVKKPFKLGLKTQFCQIDLCLPPHRGGGGSGEIIYLYALFGFLNQQNSGTEEQILTKGVFSMKGSQESPQSRANGHGGFGSQTAADLSGDPPQSP